MKKIIFSFLINLSFLSLYANCNFNNLVVEEAFCFEDYFGVIIDFEFEGEVLNSFSVHGNGQNYGSYNYSELPITLYELEADCNTPYEFVIIDESQDCIIEMEYGIVCCYGCQISNIELEMYECNNGVPASYNLNFDHDNNGGSFIVYINGNVYEDFSYNDLPIINIPAFEGTIKVCDQTYDDCCAELHIDDIISLHMESQIICDGDVYYINAYIASNYLENAILIHNGDTLGLYDTNVELTLGPFFDHGNNIELSTFSGFCVVNNYLNTADCDPEDCIEFVQAEAYRCNDSIILTMELYSDIDYASITIYNNDWDHLVYENENIGPTIVFTLPYTTLESGNLLITLHLINGSICTETVQYKIVDCIEEDCIESSPCEMSALEFVQLPCQSDGEFYIEVSNSYNQDNSVEKYVIYGNGHKYGIYHRESFPVYLGPFCTDCESEWSFLVQDYENPSCYQSEELGIICCEPLDCLIDNISFTNIECISTDIVALTVNFEYQEMESDSFNVVTIIDGIERTWTFAYTDLPVRISDFVTNGTQNQVVYLCDALNEACITTYFLELPDCSDYTCFVNGIDYKIIPQENNTFKIKLNGVVISNPNVHKKILFELNQLGFSTIVNLDQLPQVYGPFDCVDDYLAIHIGAGFEFQECGIDIINWMNHCGLNLTEGDLSNLKLFVPFGSDHIIIENEGYDLSTSTIDIYNTSGVWIKRYDQFDLSSPRIELPLPDLMSGMYYLKLQSDDRLMSLKFVTQR